MALLPDNPTASRGRHRDVRTGRNARDEDQPAGDLEQLCTPVCRAESSTISKRKVSAPGAVSGWLSCVDAGDVPGGTGWEDLVGWWTDPDRS